MDAVQEACTVKKNKDADHRSLLNPKTTTNRKRKRKTSRNVPRTITKPTEVRMSKLCDVRRVISANTTTKSAAQKAQAPESAKKWANNDIWESEQRKKGPGFRPGKRVSVFSRLGKENDAPKCSTPQVPPQDTRLDTQKLPSKQRFEEVENKVIYTDDTFGDLNTSMTLLEDF